MTIEQAYQDAVAHHQAGRLPQAEALYRQILAHHPHEPHVLHFLGLVGLQTGRPGLAVDLIGRAVALQPDLAAAQFNLGLAFEAMQQPHDAISAYRRAVAVAPDFADAYNNLGHALHRVGQLPEAIEMYRRAVALNSDDPVAQCNLGSALLIQGLIDEAIAACRRAVALNANLPEAHYNLGNALQASGQLDESIAAYRRALDLRPGYAQVVENLGHVLLRRGMVDDAVVTCRHAIASQPNSPYVRCNLGNALQAQGRLDEAIGEFQEAIRLKPDLPEAYSNLGNALKDAGGLDEALLAYRRAISLNPRFAEAHSNLLYALLAHPAYGPAAIAEEHRRWNQQHAEGLASLAEPHANDRDAERRLRIGYVSPDLRDHVVGRNVLPLFRDHDPAQVEITAYAQVTAPDSMTAELRRHAAVWRDIAGLSDERLAALVREDRIDVLVDLSLHMGGNRMRTFAVRPAPVQVTFAGYPASTGLTAIDYRLSDPYLDPPGTDESVYSERTVRLPHSFWCYDPAGCADVGVTPLPCLSAGAVTFGCLNSPAKINDVVLDMWAQVLRRVEGATLLLLARPGRHRQRTAAFMARRGVDPARLRFSDFLPRQQYLGLYQDVDIGLDSFPYNGHTTSLESWWMGVPVVTLVGQTPVARAGWSIACNLGLSELAAHSPEQFVRIAVDLAGDVRRLTDLRDALRRRMEASPLMDAQRFTRSVESCYRQMWRNWCGRAGP